MGADLIIGILEMPGLNDPDWQAAEDAIFKVCKSRDKAAKVYEIAAQISPDEIGLTHADVCDRIRCALYTIRLAWNNQLRDWVKTHTTTSTILVTGNMSWGDGVPGCDDIEFLWASGAAEAAGFVFGKPSG